jgi:hypothetical protein
MMAELVRLEYLEWQALLILYRYKERTSSPLHYVGLKTTLEALMRHKPPLAQWVGKPAENQVHISEAGVAFYESANLPE